MDREKLKGQIEAILFAAGEPVALERIAQVLGLRTYAVEELLEELQEKFNAPGSGIRLLRLENTAQFTSNPAFIQPVREALELKRNAPLSQAAMEVLAVVAYNQPVTKAYVEQVRGVDCGAVISGLVEKGLLEERGRLELPGRPLLYGTTPDFLRCLNIQSLGELPPLPRQEEPSQPEEPEEDIESDKYSC